MRAVLAAALLVAGCNGAPPVAAECEWGRVHAPSAALAKRGCEQLTAAATAIPELVAQLEPRPVELWVYEPDELPLKHAQGRTSFVLWRRLPRVQIGADELDGLLLHELVHAYLGTPAPRVPGALEEGLANWVSRTLAPQPHGRRTMLCGVTQTSRRWMGLRFRRSEERISTLQWGEASHWPGSARPTVAEALGHGRGDPYAADVAASIFYYELGTYLTSRIIERHGIDGWFELAHLAERLGEPRLTPETYLKKAGFRDEEELLSTATDELLAVQLAECFDDETFLGAIRDMREFRGTELAPAELFESCSAHLRLNDEERPFAQWPGLLEWATGAWSDDLLPPER